MPEHKMHDYVIHLNGEIERKKNAKTFTTYILNEFGRWGLGTKC